MKIKTMYTCEVCGTDYKEQCRAEQCEKSHRVDIEIARADYLPIGYDNSLKGFPVRILMKAKDGTSMLYKRCE